MIFVKHRFPFQRVIQTLAQLLTCSFILAATSHASDYQGEITLYRRSSAQIVDSNGTKRSIPHTSMSTRVSDDYSSYSLDTGGGQLSFEDGSRSLFLVGLNSKGKPARIRLTVDVRKDEREENSSEVREEKSDCTGFGSCFLLDYNPINSKYEYFYGLHSSCPGKKTTKSRRYRKVETIEATFSKETGGQVMSFKGKREGESEWREEDRDYSCKIGF